MYPLCQASSLRADDQQILQSHVCRRLGGELHGASDGDEDTLPMAQQSRRTAKLHIPFPSGADPHT